MKKIALVFICIAMMIGCKSKYDYSSKVKNAINDPFASTITESQFFEIDADKDNVIRGKQGILVTIPQCAFYSEGEQKVHGKVKMELVEALELSDMINSNLTTDSDGKYLSTDGMFFINFTQNGKQLAINKDCGIYVQIPKNTNKDMMLYSGTRDSLGNMNWSNPKKQKKFLIPVPLSSLNFTPQIFDETLNNNLPFDNITIPNRYFTDSLYYGIEEMYYSVLSYTPINANTEFMEENGGWRTNSEPDTAIVQQDFISNCKIDPVAIKALKTEKFENTFIATKEFEIRMQAIHNSCNQEVLKLYIDNLDKDLSFIDNKAAQILKGTPHEIIFQNFAKEDLGNVKDAVNSNYAQILSNYHTQKTKQFEEEIKSIQENVKKSLQKKDQEYLNHVKKYKEILKERETHRMEYYGYVLTETGWENIDIGTEPKTWSETTIDVTVTNSEKFEMLNVYVWVPFNTSLMRLIETDKNIFRTKSKRRQESIPIEKDKEIIIIGVGKIGDKHFYWSETWITNKTTFNLSFNLKETPKAEIDKMMNAMKPKTNSNTINNSNDINIDLEFQTYFSEKRKEYDKYMEKRKKIIELYECACLCCKPSNDKQMLGQELFKMNCSKCHYPRGGNFIGPSLEFAVTSQPYSFFKDFTRNSEKVIKSGDPYANKIFNDYNRSIMPAFPNLSDNDIEAIYDYVKMKVDCNPNRNTGDSTAVTITP